MTIAKPKVSQYSYLKLSHEFLQEPHEKNLKIHQNLKIKTHFENGFACLKNTILMGSKDSIKRKKKKPNLELAEQEARTKMKELSSWDPQENGSNGELGLRGRKGYAQISIWSSLALACKERNEEEE